MLIPLQAPEVWDHLNEMLRLELGYGVENPLRCYSNLYAAVEEITSQLTSFLAHKRSFTWVKGMSPLFEPPLAIFLREGFQVQGLDWKTVAQFHGQEEQWVNSLPQDTLFVLSFEDHAVTGMSQDYSGFEKALASKRIFLIRVSHFGLPNPQSEISPYTVWIGPTGYGDLAAAVCGSRFRAPERGAPYRPWHPFVRIQRLTLSEDRKLVEKVESKFSEVRWFQDTQSRRHDRIVLCFPDLGGNRILNHLEKKMNMTLTAAQAQTTHACAWNSVKLFKSWWTPAPAPEQLRGLVVFSTDIAKHDDFVSALEETVAELRKEAIWS